MMGPIGFNKKFKPGTLVLINPAGSLFHSNRSDIGTIIDNFVDFNLTSGKRTEKVLVLWPDSSTEWLNIDQVLLVPT